MSKLKRILDYIDVGNRRFKGEKIDLRELVTPFALCVEDVIGDGETPKDCYDWVVREIDYPFRQGLPWGLDTIVNVLADLHVLFRHPPRPKLSVVPFDFWKFPLETLRDRVGDCEDTSILTASMIISKFDVEETYVVLGTVKIGDTKYGHAWVECEGKLMETTYDVPPTELPDIEEVYGKVYFPEVKFNDEEILAVPYTTGARTQIQRGQLVVKKMKKVRGRNIKKLQSLSIS